MVATAATVDRLIAGVNRQHRVLWQRLDAQAAPTARRSPLDLAAQLGIALDPWQRDALTTSHRDRLLLVTRQGGKGMVASLLALSSLLGDAGSTTVVIARAERQAKRLLRRIRRLYRSLPDVPVTIVDSQYELELANGSEILALPGSEETVRGVEAVDLLIIDEAALVPDDLFAAVHPMLATTDGDFLAMTTPRGKRGWFWQLWSSDDPEWHRSKVTANEIPRIKPAWLERTRRRLGDWMYRQEFLCEFLDTDDQLYASDLVAAAMSSAVTPLRLPVLGGL